MTTEIEIAKQIYDLAKEQGWIDQLLSFIKKRHKVLVLGSSGVGKTNFLKSLHTLIPEVIHYSTRTTGTPKSKIAIDNIPFAFIDTPGQENREREIKAVQEWNEILGGNASYRLLTVITKADLWWHIQEEVYAHYETGEYFESLGSAKFLTPVSAHHSSVFHKFYGIGPLSGAFDEQDRALARTNRNRLAPLGARPSPPAKIAAKMAALPGKGRRG